jgi:hypothetical protein
MAICTRIIADGTRCAQRTKGGDHAIGKCRTPRQSSRRARKARAGRFADPLKVERGAVVAGTGVPKGE